MSSVGRNEAKICGERQIYSKRDANNHIFIHAAHWAQNSTQAKRQLSQREEAHWVFCRRFSLIYWETTSVFCEKRMLPLFPSLVRVWAFQSAPTVNAIRQIEDFFFVFGLAPPPSYVDGLPQHLNQTFFRSLFNEQERLRRSDHFSLLQWNLLISLRKGVTLHQPHIRRVTTKNQLNKPNATLISANTNPQFNDRLNKTFIFD